MSKSGTGTDHGQTGPTEIGEGISRCSGPVGTVNPDENTLRIIAGNMNMTFEELIYE